MKVKSEQILIENVYLLVSIYSNSKFKVTCKNAHFECLYIGTHTKEKPSKIANIEDAILLSSHQNIFN